MRKKILAWSLFLASLLFLSLGATPYSRTADAALITLRLTLLIVLSALVIRERWKYPGESHEKSTGGTSDIGHSFLQHCRRWYRGEGW